MNFVVRQNKDFIDIGEIRRIAQLHHNQELYHAKEENLIAFKHPEKPYSVNVYYRSGTVGIVYGHPRKSRYGLPHNQKLAQTFHRRVTPSLLTDILRYPAAYVPYLPVQNNVEDVSMPQQSELDALMQQRRFENGIIRCKKHQKSVIVDMIQELRERENSYTDIRSPSIRSKISSKSRVSLISEASLSHRRTHSDTCSDVDIKSDGWFSTRDSHTGLFDGESVFDESTVFESAGNYTSLEDCMDFTDYSEDMQSDHSDPHKPKVAIKKCGKDVSKSGFVKCVRVGRHRGKSVSFSGGVLIHRATSDGQEVYRSSSRNASLDSGMCSQDDYISVGCSCNGKLHLHERECRGSNIVGEVYGGKSLVSKFKPSVTCVAIGDHYAYALLYENGEWCYNENCPEGFKKVLEGRTLSMPSPLYIAFGTHCVEDPAEDICHRNVFRLNDEELRPADILRSRSSSTRERYYIRFAGGESFYGGDTDMMEVLRGDEKLKPENIKIVAFGQSWDSYFILLNDGDYRYSNIPVDLENALHDLRSERVVIDAVNIGPNEEWFLRTNTDIIRFGNVTQLMAQHMASLENRVRLVYTGADNTFLIRYTS